MTETKITEVIFYDKEDIDKLLKLLSTTPIVGIGCIKLVNDIYQLVQKGKPAKAEIHNSENEINEPVNKPTPNQKSMEITKIDELQEDNICSSPIQ